MTVAEEQREKLFFILRIDRRKEFSGDQHGETYSTEQEQLDSQEHGQESDGGEGKIARESYGVSRGFGECNPTGQRDEAHGYPGLHAVVEPSNCRGRDDDEEHGDTQ